MHALKLKRAGWIGLCAMALVICAKADSEIDSPGSVAAASAGANGGNDTDSDFNNLEVVDRDGGRTIFSPSLPASRTTRAVISRSRSKPFTRTRPATNLTQAVGFA